MIHQLGSNTTTPSQNATIEKVPVEVWREIFKLVCPTDAVEITPKAFTQEPWTLRPVCVYWRAVVDNFPDLWNIIDLEMSPSRGDSILKLADFERLVTAFDVLGPHLIGRRVQITFHDTYDGWRNELKSILDHSFDPGLKARIPWNQITYIQLSHKFHWHAHNVLELLRHCTSLEYLSACGDITWIPSNAPLSPIELEHNNLQELRLSPSTYVPGTEIVENLVLPKLERLWIIISGDERQGVGSVVKMLQRSGGVLKALHVENQSCPRAGLGGTDRDDVKSLLATVPALEELVLEGNTTSELIRDTCKADLSPHLSKLVVRCTPFSAGGLLVFAQLPISEVLDAAAAFSQLRSIEMEACVPDSKDLGLTPDQRQRIDELTNSESPSRKMDVRVHLQHYTQPLGTGTLIIPLVVVAQSEEESELDDDTDSVTSSEHSFDLEPLGVIDVPQYLDDRSGMS